MTLADIHVHTTFSDGNDTAETMVLEAIRRDAVIPVPELRALTSVGFTLQEAIAAGTITAAQVVGTGQEEGLLQEGRLANLIAVPGPVDESFEALNREHVKLVLHYGTIIRKEV